MADAITTNADLIDGEWALADYQLDQLTLDLPDRTAAEIHKGAWTRVKRLLTRRGIAEGDLTDSSELAPAVVCWVLHVLYARASTQAGDHYDQKSETWRTAFQREYGATQITVSGSATSAHGGYSVRVERA